MFHSDLRSPLFTTVPFVSAKYNRCDLLRSRSRSRGKGFEVESCIHGLPTLTRLSKENLVDPGLEQLEIPTKLFSKFSLHRTPVRFRFMPAPGKTRYHNDTWRAASSVLRTLTDVKCALANLYQRLFLYRTGYLAYSVVVKYDGQPEVVTKPRHRLFSFWKHRRRDMRHRGIEDPDNCMARIYFAYHRLCLHKIMT